MARHSRSSSPRCAMELALLTRTRRTAAMPNAAGASFSACGDDWVVARVQTEGKAIRVWQVDRELAFCV